MRRVEALWCSLVVAAVLSAGCADPGPVLGTSVAITATSASVQGALQPQTLASSSPHERGKPAQPAVTIAQTPTSASTCASMSGFALSLPAGISGSATPEAALKSFLIRPVSGNYDVPEGRWRVKVRTKISVSFATGSTSVTATKLADNKWIVLSGEACA